MQILSSLKKPKAKASGSSILSSSHNRRHFPNFRKSILGVLSVSSSAAASSNHTSQQQQQQVARSSGSTSALHRGGSIGSRGSVGSSHNNNYNNSVGRLIEPCLKRRSSLDSIESALGVQLGGSHSADYCNNNLATRFGKWAISSLSGGGASSSTKAAFLSTSAASASSISGRAVASAAAAKHNSRNSITASVPSFATSSYSMKRSSLSPMQTSFVKRHSLTGLSMSASSTSSADAAATASAAADATPSNNNIDASSSSSSSKPPLFRFRKSLHHSWINQLSPEDPENYELSTTKYGRGGQSVARPIFNGHYVRVRPTPLKHPKLVIHSPELLTELGFGDEDVESEAFVRYFSGDVDGAFENIEEEEEEEGAETMMASPIETWATPYALSIMGKRYTSNCPYGTGDGYGDGRAISVGEIIVPHATADGTATSTTTATAADNHPHLYPHHASRYELQLKGAGQTPFCRGADGRAVLRSSIREFLASEAMHHLRVCTTRALSLVVSDGIHGDTSQRPWYSNGASNRLPNLPSMDDPRLAKYDVQQRKEIISQIAAQAKVDPDTLVEEKCAITTRVSPSFVRIGHLDLFARRVETWQLKNKGWKEAGLDVKDSREYQELEELVWHACYREYYNEAYWPYWESKDVKGAAMALMEGAMGRISNMVAGWVRVGFVQGNFNADNCLIGGRTMDYGPFGFLDVYHPLVAKWTGSGDHFGFMNQPSAGYANFAVLVESLLPIIDANGGNSDEVRDDMLEKASALFSETADKVVQTKMGLEVGPPEIVKEADALWEEMEPFLRTSRGDWTLFWRQLTYVAAEYSPAKSGDDSGSTPDYDGMVSLFLGDEAANPGSSPFYDALSDENKATLRAWMERWHKALTLCHSFAKEQSSESQITPPEERMRLANPKYTLREWMLVEAYSKADAGKFISGDYSTINELFDLCKDPYGEGTPENHKKYYRRAPDETLRAGGTAFMS